MKQSSSHSASIARLGFAEVSGFWYGFTFPAFWYSQGEAGRTGSD